MAEEIVGFMMHGRGNLELLGFINLVQRWTTSTGESCGHAHGSLIKMVDLINAYYIKNSIGLKSTPDKSRLLPADYGLCPGRLDYGRTDKTPYTSSQLKSFLSNPVNAVYSVSTSLSNGSTSSVSFSRIGIGYNKWLRIQRYI